MTVCLVMLLAFVCELVDTSMGMGFGTAMSAILLLLGYEAADLVPCILVSELVTGAMASWAHHCLRNADFRAKSRDMRVAGVLGLGAAVGSVVATVVALNLPGRVLSLWIAGLVVLMGVFILATLNRRFAFSWSRVAVLAKLIRQA